MPRTFACRHCGFDVSFHEEDRGLEVYCDSCGRENVVPAESVESPEEPAGVTDREPDARSTVSVFSHQGAARVERRIVGEETCLCGAEIPVCVEDYGGTVYCPSCAAEIQVGGTLRGGKYRVAREETQDDSQGKPTPGGKRRIRWLHSPLGLAAMSLVALSAAAGGYFTWQHPQAVLDVVRVVSPWRQPSGAELPPPRAPAPPDPLEALPTEIEPDHEITLESIESLRSRPDPIEALVQARVWHEALHQQGASEDDERLAALAEVIEMLTAKLAPQAEGPPVELAEFRRLVQAIAEALKSGDLGAARKALDGAEGYLEQHADELTPHCGRYLQLASRVRSEEARHSGADRIGALLAKAEEALKAGNVTEGLEAEAEARFLALWSSLSDEEFKELDERERRLRAEIRFGQGRRAVEDARRCQQARDVDARNREVRRAFSLLPGLSESRIGPLLAQVRPWAAEADRSPKRLRVTSGVAREIDRRDRYEDVLGHYGRADAAGLVPACREFHALLSDDAPSERRRRKIERMLFDVLEYEIVVKLQALDAANEEDAFVERLSEVRRWLDQAEPWQASHRWKALDGAAGRQGERLQTAPTPSD